MRTLRLSLRLARWDWPATMAVGASAAILSLLFAGAAIMNATYLQAIAGGVTSDNGGLAYRLEVVDTSPELVTQLSNRPGWVAVWTAAVQVRAGSRMVPTRASTTRPSSELDGFGDLIDGQAPHRPEEASVSRALADDLAVRTGDTVTVTANDGSDTQVRLTGVYVNAIHPDEISMYRRVDTLSSAVPDMWLSDASPFNDQELLTAYNRGLVQFRSTRGLVSDQQDQAASGALAPLRYLPHFFAAVAIILLTGILAALRLRVRRTVDGLAAAGMLSAQARRVPLVGAAAVVLAGVASGYIVAITGTAAARTWMGAMFDQYWRHVAIPWGWLFCLAVGLPTLLYLFFTVGAVGHARTARLFSARGSRSRSSAVLLVAVLGLALLVRADDRTASGVSAALYGGLLLAVALPGLLMVVRLGRRTSIKARAVRTFGMSITGTAIVISAVLFLTGFFGARLAGTAAAVVPAEQPRGSLVIDGMSDLDASEVAAAYRRFSKAEIWRLRMPQETTKSLRVATPSLVTCVNALPRPSLDVAGDCPTGESSTPLNRTSFTDPSTVDRRPLPPHTVLADPQLIENGKVGLLVIDMTSDAHSIERGVLIDARPFAGLGGYLPGAVIDPADPIAAEAAAQLHVSMLVLHGFAELSRSNKAEVRGALVAAAGYARISEENGPADGGGRMLALMVTITGALVSVLLLLAATGAINTAQGDFRRLLSQLGISASRRLALGFGVLTIPFVAALSSAAIAAIASWRAGSNPLSEIELLAIPAFCALAAVLLCSALYARKPKHG